MSWMKFDDTLKGLGNIQIAVFWRGGGTRKMGCSTIDIYLSVNVDGAVEATASPTWKENRLVFDPAS